MGGGSAKERELQALKSELAYLNSLATSGSSPASPDGWHHQQLSRSLDLELTSTGETRGSGEPFLDQSMPLSVVIFGATGDLAKKKLFPALYQLIMLGHFPRHVNIIGVGRKMVDLPPFLKKQLATVKENPRLPVAEFIARISFHGGAYDSPDAFAELNDKMLRLEAGRPGNRLFFLSVPPTVFGAASEMIADKARATAPGFTHLMIEKPFGRDTPTFNELNACTSSLFHESQLFRIDHYLGKEVIQNMMTLRFANQVFEPLWNNRHIESVEIVFKEDLGTDGRGGYFDGFGIIRDIMQNHLLQVFMYMAMEPPTAAGAEALIEAKVRLLKQVSTLQYSASQVFLGQFTASHVKGKHEPGYLDDETVPKGSTCPTFASVVLEVQNERWAGVPFMMKAGKGLDERKAELRIRFKPQTYNAIMTPRGSPPLPGNELVMRIQPDESCYLKTYSKEPGLSQVVKATKMEMKWSSEFEGSYVGDAYEKMLLCAAKGDGSGFVSEHELVEAWRIFTPLLHDIDQAKPAPVLYPFGSEYPPGFADWSIAKGVPQEGAAPTPRPGVWSSGGVEQSFQPGTEVDSSLQDARRKTQDKTSELAALREELRQLTMLQDRTVQ